MSGQWKKCMGKTVVLSGAMSVMLCIFEPFQLYFTNIEEYWFDMYNLAPVCLRMFAGMFVLSLIAFEIGYLIRYPFWKLLYLVYGITFVCTYIQGNYLAGNLPVLDGNAVDWQLFDYQRKYTILLWLIVAGLTLMAVWKKKSELAINIYQGIAAVVLGVMAVTCLITGINNHGMMDKGDLTVTADKLYTYSKEGKNYVILMVDSVRGREMNELLETNEEVREELRDFTYYDNTMVGYPLTFYSIYHLMSGDWYECDEPINDYKTNILLNASLFQELEKRDYSMELYTLELPFLDNDGFYKFDNFKRAQGKFASDWKFIKLELRLVGLKYAPYDLKRRCLALPGEFDDLKVVEDIEDELYSPENDFFIRHLKDEVKYASENDFKLIHVNGAHAPFLYSRDLEKLEVETDYMEATEAAAALMTSYLNKLRDAGVYDNTAIVVLSDHGFNPDPIEDYYYNPFDRQHGVLFIKGFGETHESMQRSNAPIAHVDLPDAYTKLMDGSLGDEVFPFKEGEQRERRYLLHMNDNAIHLEEYIQTGQAGDMDTLIKTGRIYQWPDGLVED